MEVILILCALAIIITYTHEDFWISDVIWCMFAEPAVLRHFNKALEQGELHIIKRVNMPSLGPNSGYVIVDTEYKCLAHTTYELYYNGKRVINAFHCGMMEYLVGEAIED